MQLLPMTNVKDLIGKKFNRLTVIESTASIKGRSAWLCQCECGSKKIVTSKCLFNGNTKSYGCLHQELIKALRKTHGMSKSSSYSSWLNMKARCFNKNRPDFKFYGGRGITICKEWLDSFDCFFKDMGEKPRGRSLERIDNTKGYSKENCRWATFKEQSNNTRRAIKLNVNGEILSLEQACLKYKITYGALQTRLFRGWTPLDAVTIPVNSTKNYKLEKKKHEITKR